jgi:hypothetical protein
MWNQVKNWTSAIALILLLSTAAARFYIVMAAPSVPNPATGEVVHYHRYRTGADYYLTQNASDGENWTFGIALGAGLTILLLNRNLLAKTPKK